MMRMLTTFMAAALAAGVSATELPRETPAVAPDVSSWHGANLLGLFNAAPQKPDKRIRGKYEECYFRWFKDWGFNFARLPMDYRYFLATNDWTVLKQDGLRMVDQAVAWGRKYGVHVQLCIHRAPGYTVTWWDPERQRLQTDAEPQAAFMRLWSEFARRYRGIPNSELSFNLVNEPTGFTEAQYIDVFGRTIEAIRKVDPGRFVMLDGNNTASTPVAHFYKVSLTGQAFRGYTPHAISHYKAWYVKQELECEPTWPLSGAMAKRKAWNLEHPATTLAKFAGPRKAGYPVMIGEFGCYNQLKHETCLKWMEDCLKLWKKEGLGWAIWNVDGPFGFMDSDRADVAYEDFEGHELDRKMLDLLRKYAVPGLEIAAFDGAAYATVQDGGQWRIGIVNHAERLSPREEPLRIERHLTSEESFVLLEGKGELVFGEKRPFTHVPLESGKVYTVKRGVWHAVMTVPGAKIVVVEDANVSDANTERKVPGLTAYSMVTRDGRRLVSHDEGGKAVYELVPTNALPAGLPPVRHWTIYGIKSAHSDLGLHRSNFIQRKGTVRRIDEAGRLLSADRRADGDPAAFRYVIEGWWSWLNYPREKGEAAARDWLAPWYARGRVDVGGNLCGLVTHVFGFEELCRSLYPKLEMESRWGVRTRAAQMVDNPGITSGMISPLAESGIEHLTFWPNRYASSGGETLRMTGDALHPELFWWEAPNGRDRILVWTGPSYVSGGYLLGPNTAFYDRPSHPFPDKAEDPPQNWRPDLAAWERKCAQGLATLEARYPYDVWLYPDYHDDEIPSTRLADAYADWNAKWATPEFRTVGSLDEPFDVVKSRWGDRIPTVRGDISSAWASMSTAVSELHARKMSADRALPLTEALRVIAAVERGEPFPKDDLDHAYEALLLNDDHSYGFSGYTGRRVYDTWAQHRDWIEFAERIAGSAEASEVSVREGVEGVAENRWYRIAVTNGVIHSIYDKELGRELLEGPANRFLYTRDRYRTFEADPVGALRGRVRQKVWLDPDVKCIRIENTVEDAGDLLNADRMKRFGHYAFPFKVERPVFRSQLCGPVIDAHDGIVPHVADSVSVVRDWCAVEGDGFGVALVQPDTQVVEYGRLNGWPVYGFRGRPDLGHVYSRVFDDGLQWHLAVPPSFRFRYAITSYRGGWQDAHVPALAARLVRNRRQDAEIARRISMDRVNLEFVSLKIAEDGNGLVVRFRETEGRETEGALRQTLVGNAKIERVTVLERPMDQDGAFRFRPFETRSYRLTGRLPKIVQAPGAAWTGLLTRPRAFPGGEPGQMYLLWNADRRPSLDHYELFRDGVKIAEVPKAFEDGYALANVPYEDRGLEQGRSYRYQVRLVLKDGTKEPLGEAFAGQTRERIVK